MLFWAVIGYISGSLPFGYWIGKLKGVDLTKEASGNIGAANTYRVLGLSYAILVGVLDLLKGFIPTYLAYVFAGEQAALLAAMFAAIGAAFSIFLGLKGGKGFAAMAGAYIALVALTNAWGAFAVLSTLWISLMILSRIASLTNYVTILVSIPVSALIGNPALLTFSFFATVLLSYTLRKNIARLLEGTEYRVERVR